MRLGWIGAATARAVANGSDSPDRRYPSRARLAHAQYRLKANLRANNQRQERTSHGQSPGNPEASPFMT